VVATDGNHRQVDVTRELLKQAKTVATGFHPLPAEFHGKEGVDGSSPSEGSTKSAANHATSPGRSSCTIRNMRGVWSPWWSLQFEVARLDPFIGTEPAAGR